MFPAAGATGVPILSSKADVENLENLTRTSRNRRRQPSEATRRMAAS